MSRPLDIEELPKVDAATAPKTDSMLTKVDQMFSEFGAKVKAMTKPPKGSHISASARRRKVTLRTLRNQLRDLARAARLPLGSLTDGTDDVAVNSSDDDDKESGEQEKKPDHRSKEMIDARVTAALRAEKMIDEHRAKRDSRVADVLHQSALKNALEKALGKNSADEFIKTNPDLLTVSRIVKIAADTDIKKDANERQKEIDDLVKKWVPHPH